MGLIAKTLEQNLSLVPVSRYYLEMFIALHQVDCGNNTLEMLQLLFTHPL